MEVLTLLMRQPDGRTVQVPLVPAKGQEIEMPEHLAGPFEFTFTLGDERGVHEFESRLLMNEKDFVIAFKQFPVFASITKELTHNTILEQVAEYEQDDSPLQVLTLDVEKLYTNGQWLVMSVSGGSVTAFIATEKGETFVIPFYNFYESGAICTGGVNLEGKCWKDLFALIGSRTTPHKTWSAKLYHAGMGFRPKEGRIVEDHGRKIKNGPIDLPEQKENVRRLLRSTIIGKLTP